MLETDKGSQPAVPGKAEDEPTNATSKEDPSHKAALNYSRFDALYVDDGDDLNFNELDLGLEFDSQHQQAHTLAHSPKPSALPPDEDEDEDETKNGNRHMLRPSAKDLQVSRLKVLLSVPIPPHDALRTSQIPQIRLQFLEYQNPFIAILAPPSAAQKISRNRLQCKGLKML